MNIAPQSIGVITPLKALWRWLVDTPGAPQPATYSSVQASAHGVRSGTTLRGHVLRAQAHPSSPALARRPLRMVRVMEAGQTPAQVGRMVISGRMADVCAELDRLAAHEARLH